MTTSPKVIIAYMSEDERFRSVLEAAEETAAAANARLILFDADAASRFSDPLPTEWSGEGAGELFGDALMPDDLERAGRHGFAEQVRHARSRGIQAFGWLPKAKDADAIAEYADREHADLIMLPSHLEEPGLLGKLKGESSVEEAAEKAGRPVAVIDEGGNVEYR
ncbi:MAG TPA: universal stress protein [Tepidiformaceae bacterium]|nr:universal stress protein [Tepidiformaceae bacterium]